MHSNERGRGRRALSTDTWAPTRRGASRANRVGAGRFALFAKVAGTGKGIFGMEKLDAPACSLLARRLEDRGVTAPLLLSADYDGYVMTAVLRALSLLVTSRYHAQVLASGALVPAIAVSMDERLEHLSAELGCDPRLLFGVEEADLAPKLLLALDYAHAHATAIRSDLAMALASEQSRLQDMGAWLVEILREEGGAA